LHCATPLIRQYSFQVEVCYASFASWTVSPLLVEPVV